jgi:hypothetical protein
LKTLDSGFRRNDVKKNQIDFFTPSPVEGGEGWGEGAKATKGEILQGFANVLRSQWKQGYAIRLLLFFCTG